VNVGQDRRQLQVRVLQELLGPLLLRRAGLDEVPPVAGAGPETADVLRGHEAALQGPALGDHGQPGGVQLVRLGPSGQCLDLRRLVKRAVKPGFLQQEVHGLPVVAGGLHPGPLHLPRVKPGGQGLQLPAGGPELPGLLPPPGAAVLARHADSRHDRLLADVDPGGTPGEQRLVFHVLHGTPPMIGYAETGAAVRGSCGASRKSVPRALTHQCTALRAAPGVRLLDGVAPAKVTTTSADGRSPDHGPQPPREAPEPAQPQGPQPAGRPATRPPEAAAIFPQHGGPRSPAASGKVGAHGITEAAPRRAAQTSACSDFRLGELLVLASYLVLSSALSSRQQESHVNLTAFACW
jgi:hypothetical protein